MPDDAPVADPPGPTAVRLELPPTPAAPGLARRALAASLTRWGAGGPELVDDALLVTSELVTNALRHATHVLLVEVELARGLLTISAHDPDDRLPEPRSAPDDAESGRGLAILDVLAESWGVDVLPGRGKRVWARLPVVAHDTPA